MAKGSRISHKQRIANYWKQYIDHNIYDDNFRKRTWNEINRFIDELEYLIDNMPYQLRKFNINHKHIEELRDIQNGYY